MNKFNQMNNKKQTMKEENSKNLKNQLKSNSKRYKE